MTTVVLQASITVRRTPYTVKRAINNYTGSLIYLTTIVSLSAARVEPWTSGLR